MVDTWQPSKGVLFVFSSIKRRGVFLERERGGFFLGEATRFSFFGLRRGN